MRHGVESAMLCASILILCFALWTLVREGRVARKTAIAMFLLTCGLLCFGLLLDSPKVHRHVPSLVHSTLRALHLAAMINITGAFCLYVLYRLFLGKWRAHSPRRRKFLQATYATPAAVLGYGAFIERERFQLREVDFPVAGLPDELVGLRIAQITDIHIGDFMPERDVARVIDMANETRPHLAIMTGDLMTKRGDPVDVCLRQLRRLKSDAGLYGCMGNHEMYSFAEDYVEQEAARLGMQFLRGRATQLKFGGKTLNIAGVDYQSKRLGDGSYLAGVERLADPAATNLLLSHNPDTFRVTPEKGFQLQLSGHTHGGQIAVEYLNPYLNVASFVTPYVAGYYHERGSSLYVSRGVGTIGLPVRVGVPPEVTLLRLRRPG